MVTTGELAGRTEDADEKVRAAICKVFGSLDYETALHHLKKSTLETVAARLSDKKIAVRAEALSALSRLWNSAYVNMSARLASREQPLTVLAKAKNQKLSDNLPGYLEPF